MSGENYSAIDGGDFPPDAKTLVFRGISGAECEHFVRSVRFIALAEGQDEDDRWMLRFATARLAGRALRWHARLDKEIRKDWDRLILAMLDEYAADSEEAPIVSDRAGGLQHAIAELPATPPQEVGILGPGLHVGLIRVVPKLGAPPPLYVSKDQSLGLTTKKTDALQVQFLQSVGPYEVDILQHDYNGFVSGEGGYYISVIGRRLALERLQTRNQGGVFKFCSSYKAGLGVLLKSWRVTSDNVFEVIINNPPNGTVIQPQTLVVSQYHQCLFLENYNLWAEGNPGVIHYEARLVFESL